MMVFPISFQPVPADYPNHLAAPLPERLVLQPAGWLLFGLFCLCLLPRALVASHIPCIAGDGVLYVSAAKALEACKFHDAFWEGGVNVYVVILAALHHLGLDWETAAILWGLMVSSLVVLPLWGWVRRQFDDRVALVACLLYIIHPKFILESPELMRDPTFWFFFTTSLYFLWRAVSEVHYGYFIASGVTITLALLTRTEGLVLLIPLTLWVFWRFRSLETNRRKLLVGVGLCIAVFPMCLVLVNLVWLYGSSDWATIRLSPLARAWGWLGSLLTSPEVNDGNGEGAPPKLGLMVWRFFPTITRGLSPVFAILMLGGLWGWRRVWSRRDHQVLFYAALAILVGIWIQAWSNRYLKGNINARYALPIVLMAAPFAALGLMAFTARVLRITEKFKWQAKGRIAALVGIVLLAVVPGIAEILHNNLNNYDSRLAVSQVGRWLHEQCPSSSSLVGPWDWVRPISFYAGCDAYSQYRYGDSDKAILQLIQKNKADVVLLRTIDQMTPDRCRTLVKKMDPLGLKVIRHDVLNHGKNDIYVLVRDGKAH